MEEKQRVIVYIDGFNFYYGLKSTTRWRKYYWLDIVKLFESFMRPNQDLIEVKYFSARPDDIEQSRRQNAFFQANKENPKFRLILGKYLKKRDYLFQVWECNSYSRGKRNGCKDCDTDRSRRLPKKL